jgi:chemosensory pili system protein ChpA (sensor histidine kinase/response regulator)
VQELQEQEQCWSCRLAEELEWPPQSGAVAAELGADAQPAQREPAFAMPELDFSLEELPSVPVQEPVLVLPESATADFALPQLDIPDDLLQQLAAPELLEASALPTLESEGSRAGADRRRCCRCGDQAQPVPEQSSGAEEVQELDFAAFEAAMRESEQAAIDMQTAVSPAMDAATGCRPL